MADAFAADADLAQQLDLVRTWLTDNYGPFLLTEHGRIPICDDEGSSSAHDDHCYHAHLLAFQTNLEIDAVIDTYFRRSAHFGDTASALGYAAALETYVSVSQALDSVNVYSGPLNIPRQLTRSLVASRLGTFELSDWRAFPDRPTAIATAARLRPSFADRFGNGN
jgi:hypothetical protein